MFGRNKCHLDGLGTLRKEGRLSLEFWRRFADEVVVPWARLTRISNLLTVVGDTLAGAFLACVLTASVASIPRLLDAVCCSMMLYTFGIIQNDYCDYEEDRKNRRNRPLPRGEITLFAAMFCSLLLLGSALFLLYCNGSLVFFVGVVLAILINMYNLFMKRDMVRGAVCMGLCRGFDMLLGACIVDKHSISVFFPMIATGVYIFFVTMLAANEHRHTLVRTRQFYLVAPFVVSWIAVLPFLYGCCGLLHVGYSLLCLVFACLSIVFSLIGLGHGSVAPEKMQRCIGALLGVLIPWQVCWIVLYASHHILWVLLVFACLWGLYTWAGRHISQS